MATGKDAALQLKPGDEVVVTRRDLRAGEDLLPFGVSAIGEVDDSLLRGIADIGTGRFRRVGGE